MSNITGNKRNVDDTLNANKKSKTLLPPPPPANVLPPPQENNLLPPPPANVLPPPQENNLLPPPSANVLPPPPASVLPPPPPPPASVLLPPPPPRETSVSRVNKKPKTKKNVKINNTIRIRRAPKYITEYTMNFKKPGQDYNSPKHINGESPSASEYQLESSEEGTLKPMSPETILKPLASEYRAIYLLSIGNNTIPIVDNKGQSYVLLYEPTENIKNIYEDAIDGLNNNELHILSHNGLTRIAIDMVKDKVIRDKEGNIKKIKKQIYFGRTYYEENDGILKKKFRKFGVYGNSIKLKAYQKFIQTSGSDGENYFYVVIELNNTISGGSKSTEGSEYSDSLKKHSKKRLTKTIKNKK
jgi:hypothetical protein